MGQHVQRNSFFQVLLTPGYIIEPASNNRGRELFEAGKKFYGSGELNEEDNEPEVCQLFFALF